MVWVSHFSAVIPLSHVGLLVRTCSPAVRQEWFKPLWTKSEIPIWEGEQIWLLES